MVLAQIFYNFGSLSVSAYNGASRTAMSISKNLTGPPVTNIRYNDVSYYLRTMYFYYQNGPWVIFEAVTDPNGSADGDTMYIAAKIKLSATSIPSAPFPIDQIVNSGNSKTNAVPVAWDVNQDILEGNKAFLSIDSSTGTKTLILFDGAHNIRSSLTTDTFPREKCYNHPVNPPTSSSSSSSSSSQPNTIPRLAPLPASTSNEDQPNFKANVTITKSILDWNITCELEGEDEATEQPEKVTKDMTTQQILGAMSGIAIVAILMYMYTPSFFGGVMVPLAETLKATSTSMPPYKSLAYFWNTILAAIMLQVFVFGVSGNGVGFFYMFFGILIVGFLCNKSIAEYNTAHNGAWSNNASGFDLLRGEKTQWPMIAFIVVFIILWSGTWPIGTEGKFFQTTVTNKILVFTLATGMILSLAITFLLWLGWYVGGDNRGSGFDYIYMDYGKWIASAILAVFIGVTAGYAK